jgi:hypothetical protein
MIYSIRVDVSADDRSVRIIDSILVDPSCLPIPYISTEPLPSTITSNVDQLKNIQDNAEYLANMLIADMEVQSYNKLHKIGRIKLIQVPNIVKDTTMQISKQLKDIIFVKEPDRLKKIRKKRRLDESKEDNKDTTDLVNIKLRIREESYNIKDDFTIDRNDERLSNPILIAQSICKDLNVPSHLVNSVAICISEQLCGLEVQEDCTGLTYADPTENHRSLTSPNRITKRIQVEKGVPSAWKMDDKEAAIVKQHYLTIGMPSATSVDTVSK